mmetsp:Transcript_4351/g.5012  ORF Transcript_4351/g.5012 Transcript_4351/m.5012 type:complete len:84 (-) Transcript_4351:765-1016(-)
MVYSYHESCLKRKNVFTIIFSSTHLLINYYAIPNITLICLHYIPSIQTPNIFQSHHDYTIEGTSILAEDTNTKCYRIDPLRGC